MFSTLSGWVLSIAGVVSLSVIVELIMPEGGLNKYIRGVFSFIIMLVIIAPLPSLVGKSFDFSNISLEGQYQLQEDYIYQMNVYKTQALQNDISNQIKQSGYDNVVVSVSSENYSSQFKIKAIYVELANLVINGQAQHTNIVDIEKEILQIILSRANVDEAEVHFER